MDPPDSGPSKCLVGYLRPSASTSERTTVDLSHSAEDEQFRSDVREWLGDNLVGDFAELKGLGGSGKDLEAHDERLEWDRPPARNGRASLGWPPAPGRRGLSLSSEECRVETECGRTCRVRWATDRQKKKKK